MELKLFVSKSTVNYLSYLSILQFRHKCSYICWTIQFFQKNIGLTISIMILTGMETTSANTRSSHRRCSIREGILRNFTGKHLCQSLFFNKVAALLIKRLWHRCFPVNFAKFLRTPFLQNTSGQLLLKYNRDKHITKYGDTMPRY